MGAEDDVAVAARDLAQQPHYVETEVDRVTGDDDEAIEPPHEPSARIGEEDVNEDQGRQKKKTDSPIARSAAESASASRESAGTSPATTIKGPNWLSGLLDQAMSPQPT